MKNFYLLIFILGCSPLFIQGQKYYSWEKLETNMEAGNYTKTSIVTKSGDLQDYQFTSTWNKVQE